MAKLNFKAMNGEQKYKTDNYKFALKSKHYSINVEVGTKQCLIIFVLKNVKFENIIAKNKRGPEV